MKILKIILLILLVVFVGIQFIPTNSNQSKTIPKTDFMFVNTIPNNIKKKLQISCYDCHSNNTNYPWYNKIQPVAWFLEDHIKDGKKELNFNTWNTYSTRRKKSKLKSIISQIKDDEMPLTSYTFIHADAKFTKKEKKEIIEWLTQLRDSV
ncbi:heme-binding domain-containing protein [Polaribacter gochangensis]|uniref:heme-binding domain-containing protein n=1 Tax=Polaribacter gochangensis TaxID=3252903 RepID=UPI003904A8C7